MPRANLKFWREEMKEKVTLILAVLTVLVISATMVSAQTVFSKTRGDALKVPLSDEVVIANFASDSQRYSTLVNLLSRNIDSKDAGQLITVIDEMKGILNRFEINAPVIAKKLESQTNTQTIFPGTDEYRCLMSFNPPQCLKNLRRPGKIWFSGKYQQIHGKTLPPSVSRSILCN